MVRKTAVRKNRYLDSVFLMLVAQRIASQPGIHDASAMLATEANRKLLAGMGYGDDGKDKDFAAAGPNDLVLAVEGDAAAVDAVMANADSYFARGYAAEAGSAPEPRSIAEAVTARPESSVAVISVPGEYAAREARAALRAGLHVFLFSSNVSVDDELALKRDARDRGLIVMGPDCGTGYLGGAGIGFANVVRRGPIGIVGASGTGMQEFASLVHRAGSGISNGIGTGSRDPSDAIGAISTIAGVDALESDAATKVIAVISKPPGESAIAVLAERLRRCKKPVVTCFFGEGHDDRIKGVSTLDEAVGAALVAAGEKKPQFLESEEGALQRSASSEKAKLQPGRRYVRGFFAGGTLCYQAQSIFRRAGLSVYSNSPLHGMKELTDPYQSREHTFVDMGAETFVHGRPHPMIDATLRRRRLEQEARDPSVAVILLDFVLGSIASADPVSDLLGAIQSIRTMGICVAASVCGTNEDRQSLEMQERSLRRAGAMVFASSAQAASFCREAALLLGGGE
ncbi:MAG: hypothetical protein JO292_13570 [Betaproteobacteria bacterium]|nr:hypothetical protein [Betaproteobacteria bacterium]MBV9362414.1 hypothetical protein [Betaproteobacteria bacterium]